MSANWHDMIVAPANVQATQRVSAGKRLGTTPQSANLGLTPSEQYWRDRNRRDALMPDNWAALTPAQLQRRRDRLLAGPVTRTVTREAPQLVRVKSDTELIEHWYNKAREQRNPARFVAAYVPERLREAVLHQI